MSHVSLALSKESGETLGREKETEAVTGTKTAD